MKKLFNKALIYQYYMMGRWPMIIGGLIFTLISYFVVKTDINQVKYAIAAFHFNTKNYVEVTVLFTSWLVLASVYFFITGINKKNSMIFLQSGPFTKEQIKVNQIIMLFASLLIMLLGYLYVYLCLGYKNHELVTLIPNFYKVLTRDFMRIALCGMAFISYLVFMDMIFSNIIIEIIMIPLCPLILVFLLFSFTEIYFSVIGHSIYSIGLFENLGDILNSIYDYVAYNCHRGGYFAYNPVMSVRHTMVLILVLTCLLFVASWFLNKNYKMNNINKLFNFRFIQVLFEYFVSLSIVFTIENIVLEIYNYRFLVDKSSNILILYFVAAVIGGIFGAWLLCRATDKYITKYL